MNRSEPKPGRTHNAEGAREAILNAAEEVFAQHGFDGARIDAIAAAAGYNKSLLFQYFGDKFSLYVGVIRRADEQTQALQNQVLAEILKDETSGDIQGIKALLRSFLSAYFDYLAEHPNFVRILNWEMAGGWQTYARIVTERDHENIDDLSALIQKIEASGWSRTQYNPQSQMIFGLFANHLFFGLLPLFKIYAPVLNSPSDDRQVQGREFLIDFIIHGLIADPGMSTVNKPNPSS